MNLKPLHDRVVLKRVVADEKSPGGILIPENAQEKPNQADVVAVGPGVRDDAGRMIPMGVKVGDRVLVGKWIGTEVKVAGEELLILKETEIMGVLV